MIEARFVPIEQWPGTPLTKRRRAQFKTKYEGRLKKLEYELRYLGANGIVIQAYFQSYQIRNDGWPVGRASPSRPGIVLSFRNRSGESLSFPCDTYDDWTDNLHAIGLGLEALRAVDRYGVTQRGEQYQGWKRLSAPAVEKQLDFDWAVNHLAALAGTTPAGLRDPATFELAYRAAARKTHPDSGGNIPAFQLLQDAMALIRGKGARA